MQSLLVFSQDPEMGDFLQMSLEEFLPYKVHLAHSYQESKKLLLSKNIRFFTLDLEDKKGIHYIYELRRLGIISPILLLVDPKLSRYFLHSKKQLKLHLLLKPFQEKDFLGLSHKLIVSKTIPQQVFKRFQTNQPAVVGSYGSGEDYISNMYNLSRGGAYCEVNGDPRLAVGECVRIKIPLKELESHHVMNAKVVWTTRKGPFTGQVGVGVKFVNPNDVYKQLAEGV